MDSTRQPPPLSRSPSPSPSSQLQQFQVEVTVVSAKHLKNVNWKQGDLKPYAVVYLDQDRRLATKPDEVGSTKPVWNERFVLPVPTPSLEDAVFYVEVFHSKPSETPKSPFVGAARYPLTELLPSREKQPLYDQYIPHGGQIRQPRSSSPVIRTLELRRSSGRPQGKIRLKVSPIIELPPPHTSPPIPSPHTTAIATIPSVPPPPPADYHRLSSPYPNSSGCFDTNYADYATAAPPLPSVPEDYRRYTSPANHPLPNQYAANPLPSPQMPPQSRPPYNNISSFSEAPPYPFGGGYNYPTFAGAGYYSAPPASPRMLPLNVTLPPNMTLPPPSVHGSSVSARDFPSRSGPSAPLDYYAPSQAPYQYKQQRERAIGSGSVDLGVSSAASSFHNMSLEEAFPRNYEEDAVARNNRDMVARNDNYRDCRAGF